MLILVAVTITVAVNGGLFNYASDAGKKTNEAITEEQMLAEGKIKIDDKWYDSMDDYIKGIVSGTERFSEIKTANYEYTDSNNVTVTIPAGFAYGTSAGINTVAGGLVITDAVDENGLSTGNEFVWIPVKDEEFTRTGWWENNPTNKTLEEIADEIEETLGEEGLKKYVAKLYGYDSIDELIENSDYDTYEEWLADDYDGTIEGWFKGDYWWAGALGADYKEENTQELQALTTSVETYGGFYIGRYEAGYSEGRTNSNKATTEKPLSKKGVYPYNYIKWTDAKARSEGMYEGSNSVVSTLCYGVQWDATLRFIRDKVNVTNSTNWGNYNNHEFTFSEKYYTFDSWKTPESNTKPNGSGWLLTTGASEQNKAKNIYDLAGNVYEWTMEAYSSYRRVYRGGGYESNGASYPASYRRSYYPTGSNDSIGFRAALYISEV